MTDIRVERMARTIVEWSTALKPGQLCLIQADPGGYPLAREVFRHAIRAGAHPYIKTMYAEMDEILLGEGNEQQIAFVPETDRLEMEKIDARVMIRAPENTRSLAGVNSAKLTQQRRARQAVFNRMLERKGRGELATCVTQFPTHASAQEAGMSLADYEEFVFRACFVDRPDPVAEWRKLSAEQQRYVDLLNTLRDIRVEGPGTELRLSIAGRKWVNSDGKANFPSGEVFTSPVEDSVEGRIYYDVPCPYAGHDVEGIELQFKAGRVVEAKAQKGDDYLRATLDTDAGARTLGEFAFGLNYGIKRATRNILFDEKLGGTIHLALGSGYIETGSANRSSIHWDMIKDMKEGRVWADGTVIYENGRFVVG